MFRSGYSNRKLTLRTSLLYNKVYIVKKKMIKDLKKTHMADKYFDLTVFVCIRCTFDMTVLFWLCIMINFFLSERYLWITFCFVLGVIYVLRLSVLIITNCVCVTSCSLWIFKCLHVTQISLSSLWFKILRSHHHSFLQRQF